MFKTSAYPDFRSANPDRQHATRQLRTLISEVRTLIASMPQNSSVPWFLKYEPWSPKCFNTTANLDFPNPNPDPPYTSKKSVLWFSKSEPWSPMTPPRDLRGPTLAPYLDFQSPNLDFFQSSHPDFAASNPGIATSNPEFGYQQTVLPSPKPDFRFSNPKSAILGYGTKSF